MARSSSQRVPIRIFNRASRLLGQLRVSDQSFSQDQLVAEAQQATGLDDFGDDHFRGGLAELVRGYNREARLNPFGRLMVRAELSGILKSRLAVIDGWKRDPACLEAAVRPRIFVLGLPRTGTTTLHDLLAQDPAHQALDYWLAAAPGPRPEADQVKRDPRYKRARQFLKVSYYLDPGLRAIHNLTDDDPDECRHLLQESFTDDMFYSNATLPSYTEWYARQDMRPSYRHHRDVLKLIQSTCSERRWVLKYPAHLRHLEILLETYPDACIVQTHRDPARVIPSLCSLVTRWRGIYEDEVDPVQVGNWQLEMWQSRMERAIAVRAGARPEQFFDIQFREVVEDPLGVIQRMYDHFGLELSEAARRRMRDRQRSHPPGQFGQHRYHAEDFGLSESRMAERFKAYTDHFEVPLENVT